MSMPVISLPLYQSKLSSFPSINTPFLPFSFSSNKLSSSVSILYNASHVTSHRLSSTGQSVPATSTNPTSVTVETDNWSDSGAGATAFVIHARNRIGLLQVITRVFKVLGLRVEKATVEFEGEYFTETFHVTDSHGNRIEDADSLDKIKKALIDAIDGGDGAAELKVRSTGRGVVVRRAGLGLGERRAMAERMFGLMDRFLKNDPICLQRDILDHVEYTVARSRFNFDDFEAYQVILVQLVLEVLPKWIGIFWILAGMHPYWFSFIFMHPYCLILIQITLRLQLLEDLILKWWYV